MEERTKKIIIASGLLLFGIILQFSNFFINLVDNVVLIYDGLLRMI